MQKKSWKIIQETIFLSFIEPPSKDELFKRLKDRGADSISTIEKRMERFESEMMYKIHFNYVIVNNKLNDAVNAY